MFIGLFAYFCAHNLTNMTNEELDERVARAVDYFMQGYGCCQSVVAAFSDIYGLDECPCKKIIPLCHNIRVSVDGIN